MMKMNILKLALVGILTTGLLVHAQDDGEDEVFELSPFAVTAADDVGYRATTTLAGSRVRSNIGDLGASIAVITEEFMEDTGATDGDGNRNRHATLARRTKRRAHQRICGLVHIRVGHDHHVILRAAQRLDAFSCG
mgnify:CR=1 FL=1